MTIDLDKIENLLLSSSYSDFIIALSYISNIKKENIGNIFFELTKTTSIRDYDLKFIINYLSKTKYISLINEQLIIKNEIIPDKVINNFTSYYFSILQSNNELNSALFLNSEFKIENDEIIIFIDSVKLKYRSFFIVLQKLGLVEKTSDKGYLRIKNYSLAKKFLERPLKKISQEEFEKELEQKKIKGLKAELYVLKNEELKLEKYQFSPKRVSVDNVTLGYDIESYNINGEIMYIEVKSLMKGNSFIWTENEIRVSKQLTTSYFIYCVLFDKNNNPIEIKEIINDPYSAIFEKNIYKKNVIGDYMISI